MVAAECLRLELRWPEAVRAPMMLGALAPDAHTETERYDRTFLHPEPGADVAAYVIAKLRPAGAIADPGGRAFALAVMAHILGDEMFRHGPLGLTDSAPLGLQALPPEANALAGWKPALRGSLVEAPVPFDARLLDLPAMREDLAHAQSRFGLEPLSAEQIVAKRVVALERPPLSDATGPYAMAPELAAAMEAIVTRTIALAEGTALLRDE